LVLNQYASTATKLEGIFPLFEKLEKAEDGWIVAECPALPGCVSQGRNEKEALENIKEAITTWLWAEDQKAAKLITKKQSKLFEKPDGKPRFYRGKPSVKLGVTLY